MHVLLCSSDPLLKAGSQWYIWSCQVDVAIHHYLLISGGAREGSVSWNGWAGCCPSSNNPQHNHHILHTIILTPEGDVTSSTHIRGSWVGLSEVTAELWWSLLYKQTSNVRDQDLSTTLLPHLTSLACTPKHTWWQRQSLRICHSCEEGKLKAAQWLCLKSEDHSGGALELT